MTPAVPEALAAPLPPDARRLIIYSVFDKDGQVDDFVVRSLSALRAHAARILVVVNGDVTPAGLASLESVSDEVLVRENQGFDIGAHRAALRHVGGALNGFDEVILTNDTWYGPVRPWAPVFERMDRVVCDFWGLTDHAPSRANPFTPGGEAPYHLQSYWIAVRRSMFASARWRDYWADLPALDSYVDAVIEHELRFTQHFASSGWTARAAFAVGDFDTENPSLFEAETLIERGCPVLKRRALFHWPPLLDAHASVGAWTLAAATAEGYPVELILTNLARTVPPKAMNVDAGLLSVLPGATATPAGNTREDPPGILVILHSEGAPIEDALRRAEAIHSGFDLIVTTTDPEAEATIAAHLAGIPPSDRRTEVRVMPRGASAASALLIGCRDALLAGNNELIVRLHALPAADAGEDRRLTEHGYGNLLPDREYFSALCNLFRTENSLGIVYPPPLHVGRPSSERSWGESRPAFEAAARSLGISVPLDDVSPLAPSGGMFVARAEALRLLAEHPWTPEQLDTTMGLVGAVERMWSYAAGQLGFHTRTVASRDYLSGSHSLLEYELDAMSASIPGRPYEKIDFLRHSGSAGSGTAGDLLRMYVRRRQPWLMHAARRMADPARLPGRLLPGRTRESRDEA